MGELTLASLIVHRRAPGCGAMGALTATTLAGLEANPPQILTRTALCFGTRGRTSGSGSTSAAARLSATTSTLSARGKQSADTTTTLVGLGRNRDNNSINSNNMSDINIRHNNINDNDIDIDTDINANINVVCKGRRVCGNSIKISWAGKLRLNS